MKTIEYRTVDKTAWGPGPWQEEPDKKQWRDEETGLPCLIVRNRSGALCGYVGVSNGHPAFEKSYNDVDVSVHGGLTFAAECHGSICHVVEPGEDDHVWWLGFDCAHSGDSIPGTQINLLREGVYRDLNYVTREVENLAAQLASKTE